jgi:hypothetical protein
LSPIAAANVGNSQCKSLVLLYGGPGELCHDGAITITWIVKRH